MKKTFLSFINYVQVNFQDTVIDLYLNLKRDVGVEGFDEALIIKIAISLTIIINFPVLISFLHACVRIDNFSHFIQCRVGRNQKHDKTRIKAVYAENGFMIVHFIVIFL